MFGDWAYLGRQLLRFSIATFAVICAVMIVWWNMTPEAALDRRSASARAKQDLQTFHNSLSVNSNASGVGSLDSIGRSIDRMGEKLGVIFNHMLGRDRNAITMREHEMRGLFNAPPQSARVNEAVSGGRPLVRGLSAADLAILQNHGKDAVQVVTPAKEAELPEPSGTAAPAKGKNNKSPPKREAAKASLRGGIVPAPTPVKTSAVVGERSDFNALNAALVAAEEDYRAFPQALEQVQAFLERYPSSTRRPQFASKIDSLAALRNRAEEERAHIDGESILMAVDFTDTELERSVACLNALPSVQSIAMISKAVVVQKHIPAYYLMADAGFAKRLPDAVTPDMRTELAASIVTCFPRPQAAGSMKVMFWPEGDAFASAQRMARVEGALVYARN